MHIRHTCALLLITCTTAADSSGSAPGARRSGLTYSALSTTPVATDRLLAKGTLSNATIANEPAAAHCPFVSLLAFAPGVLVVSFIGFFPCVFDFDM
jgi:hypothetical protein